MTVGELIESLKALPLDMKIQVLDSDYDESVDIVQVSRGTWSDDDMDMDDFDPDLGSEFIQDDENGKIAVLITW